MTLGEFSAVATLGFGAGVSFCVVVISLYLIVT